MSDKNLTEIEWKKFSKGRGYKDAPFTKALAALEKAKAPDAELEALAEIEKQADALRKASKADKELGSYLDGLDKALDKHRKLAEFEARKAAAKKSSAEEEEESPALLTSKMVPLIRQVKKGDEMQALLGVVGKDVVVMLARRPISPSRRKLMTDYLDAGALKFFAGTCVFEENAYTFVLKTQASGLAKKVKAALLKQVELRLKVRVRGEEPGDIDDDGDPVEDENPAAPMVAGPAAAPAVSNVKLQQARLAWDAARKKIQADIAALQKDILAKSRDEPDFADIAQVIKGFETLKGRFDKRLIDKLDEALNAAPEQRPPLHREAVAMIDAYQAQVDGEPLLRDLDDNPFVKVTVQATLNRTLGYLAQQLK